MCKFVWASWVDGVFIDNLLKLWVGYNILLRSFTFVLKSITTCIASRSQNFVVVGNLSFFCEELIQCSIPWMRTLFSTPKPYIPYNIAIQLWRNTSDWWFRLQYNYIGSIEYHECAYQVCPINNTLYTSLLNPVQSFKVGWSLKITSVCFNDYQQCRYL